MSSSLGVYLRELRERRGVSLDEISRVTRVARSYLEALETGEVSKLPAPVFTRGFIRAYCQVLGASADEALARYDEGTGERAEEHREAPQRPTRASTSTRGPLLVSFILLVVFGLALLGVTLALRSGRATPDRREETRTASATREPSAPTASPTPGQSAPSTSPTPPRASSAQEPRTQAPPSGGERSGTATPNATTPSPAPARTPPPPPASPSMRPPGAVEPSAPVPPATAATPAVPDGVRQAQRVAASASAPFRLTARTTERTWLRVRTEDGKETEENVPAGQVREWVSNRRFVVSIGNAGGVHLELNGQALPAFGPSGAVVLRVALPPVDSP